MAKLSSSITGVTVVTVVTGVTVVPVVPVVLVVPVNPVVTAVPEVVLELPDGVTKVVLVVDPEVVLVVDPEVVLVLDPEVVPVVDPEVVPVVDPEVDPPVVVPVVTVETPLVVMVGLDPPPVLRFLNKKINPIIKAIKSKAPNKYQIQDGHPTPFFFAFLFSSTGAGTVLTTGAVINSSLSICFG